MFWLQPMTHFKWSYKMQESKDIERTIRTRTKNPERVEKLLEREKKKRAIKARAISTKINRPLRRGLQSIGIL